MIDANAATTPLEKKDPKTFSGFEWASNTQPLHY